MGETATRLQAVSEEAPQERKPRRIRSDDEKLREILQQKEGRIAKLRKQLEEAHARVKELEPRLVAEEQSLQQLAGMVGAQPSADQQEEVVP